MVYGMMRRNKKSKYKYAIINKKRYYFYTVRWVDICGDSGHATKEEFDKAKADCEKSIEMDENDPEGYYYLAEIYDLQENYFKALKNYNLAILKLGGELDYYISNDYGDRLPKSAIFLKLAELYLKVDEKEIACEDYQKALELMKDEPFYMNKGKDQKALEEKIKTLCN